MEFCFGDDEVHQPLSLRLRFEDGVRKIHQPGRDLAVLVILLQHRVVIAAPAADRLRKSEQGGPGEAFADDFARERATDPAIAILKRMDGNEMQMGHAGAREDRQGRGSIRPGAGIPCDEGGHLAWHGG